jgi:hypothetical protein
MDNLYYSYVDVNAEKAINDFKLRIAQYEKSYQTLDSFDSELSE